MSAVTADYDECTCIGGRCMRKEQSYASAFFTFWLVTVKALNSYNKNIKTNKSSDAKSLANHQYMC